jgi:DNA-binding CsgD family transcriptional regulator
VALRTATEIYDRLSDRLFLFTYDPGAVRDLVGIALDANAPAQAERVVAAARVLAERNPTVASLGGAAANAEGLLRKNRGLLRAAVDRLRDSPRRLVRARAMEDAALAELSAGRRADAVRLLEEALDENADCGASAAVHRIEARLRDAGARPRGGGSRGGGSRGGDARDGDSPGPGATQVDLTPAEWPVAQRVAQGMTNREIATDLRLSRHTVDTHLRHIFAKLNVNSRAAVAAWVSARENG